jgi:heme-degrading monooxygenase HmoA
MAIISPDSGYLTVLNIFRADSVEKQFRLLGAMREIVDAAAYEGWVSSTVHSGVDKIGTANFIQWEKQENLEQRYASDEFKHQIPLFTELTTSVKLLQTEVFLTQRIPSLGDETVASPSRDDYTVIEIFHVAPENLDELVATLGKQGWLLDTPGYRSHSVLRGKALRGKRAVPLQGSFVVSYAQWDGKSSYDAFRNVPEAEQNTERRHTQSQIESLAISVDSNTYHVVHSRTNPQM